MRSALLVPSFKCHASLVLLINYLLFKLTALLMMFISLLSSSLSLISIFMNSCCYSPGADGAATANVGGFCSRTCSLAASLNIIIFPL